MSEREEMEGTEKSLGWGKALRSALILGIVFALIGILFGTRIIAVQTLPHIVTPGNAMNFQEVSLIDNLPVARLMDWNQNVIDVMLVLSNLNWIGILILGGGLCFLLWLLAVSTLNPTFRLIQISRASAPIVEGETETPPSKEPLHVSLNTKSLQKAMRLLLVIGLSVALVWAVTGVLSEKFGEKPAPANVSNLVQSPLNPTEQTPPALTKPPVSPIHDPTSGFRHLLWLIRWTALGIALWVGFHRRGLAGDFADSSLQSLKGSLPGLLGSGILFGIGTYLVVLTALPSPLEDILLRYHTLGTFHTGYWSDISSRTLLSMAGVWFAAGTLLVLLGHPQLKRPQRGLLLLAPLLTTFLSVQLQKPLTMGRLAKDKDITPRILSQVYSPYDARYPGTGIAEGVGVGHELAHLLGLKEGANPAQPSRNLLLFNVMPRDHFPEEVAIIRQEGFTEDGLTADPASAEPIRKFLQQRHYQTALSWVATKHLFNVGTIHFDPTSAMAACMEDLKYGPHLVQSSQVIRSMLFTSSATPQNLALLDEFASEENFLFPMRETQKMLGNLYIRFGMVEKALKWYRMAEMPKSFIAKIKREKPMFHEGHVTGTLTLNGKPLVGVQVGLIPRRLNGLPLDMEPRLFDSIRELVPFYPQQGLFPPFHPRPFAFRWVSVSTTTDANGHFTFNNLIEGEYRLMSALPPDMNLETPVDKALHYTHAPFRITLNYDLPQHDVGTIALTYKK